MKSPNTVQTLSLEKVCRSRRKTFLFSAQTKRKECYFLRRKIYRDKAALPLRWWKEKCPREDGRRIGANLCNLRPVLANLRRAKCAAQFGRLLGDFVWATSALEVETGDSPRHCLVAELQSFETHTHTVPPTVWRAHSPLGSLVLGTQFWGPPSCRPIRVGQSLGLFPHLKHQRM